MSHKAIAFAAALLFAAASASAATPIVLSADGANQWSASFSGMASGDNTYTLDLSSFASGWSDITLSSLLVTANFSGNRGYDVTRVTFDGDEVTAAFDISIPGTFGVDVWAHEAYDLTPTVHTLVVTGNLIGGTTGFTGSLTVQAQPVPEPESYMLMLAGLAAVGSIVRRRSVAR